MAKASTENSHDRHESLMDRNPDDLHYPTSRADGLATHRVVGCNHLCEEVENTPFHASRE